MQPFGFLFAALAGFAAVMSSWVCASPPPAVAGAEVAGSRLSLTLVTRTAESVYMGAAAEHDPHASWSWQTGSSSG